MRALVIGSLIAVSVAARAGAAECDAYVFAGQSNSLGFINASYYKPTNADKVIRFYPEVGGRDNAQEDMTVNEFPVGDGALPRWEQKVTRTALPLAPVNVGGHMRGGSEIQFGRLASQVYGASRCTIVAKFAFGGTSLEQHWINSDTVDLVDRLVMFLSQVKRDTVLRGDTFIVRGFVFDQGEADTLSPAYADVYGDNLRLLVEKVRMAARNPHLPVVITRTSSNPLPANSDNLASYNKVREAQREFTLEDTCSALVSTDDLPHVSGVHFQPPSYYTRGKRQFMAYYRTAGLDACHGVGG